MAAGAEGVLDARELAACGLSAQAIVWRAHHGRIHRIHEGVYAVGHPGISLHGRFIAAVKACRPNAALSHRAAAAYWEFLAWTERDIEVTVWDGVDHRRDGVEVHRSDFLTRADCVERNGILITNPTWTVVALASVLRPTELRPVVKDALRSRLVSTPALLRLLARVGPIRGSRRLRDILARGFPTRSELEEVVLDAIAAGGLVMPQVNVPLELGGRVVIPDFRWPEQRLVLEADGVAWHDDPLSRRSDAERQDLLEAHGETVIRARWGEAARTPAALAARLVEAGAPLT